MTPLHRAFALLEFVLLASIVTGLATRKRWRSIPSFDGYVGLGLLVTPMLFLWPDRFFRQWFVLSFETIASMFKLGIAVEVGWRTFRPFPGARTPALVAALMILGVTALLTTAAPLNTDPWEWEVITGQLFPRVKTGTLWLMAVTLILAYWYHVPVEPFDRAVLTSFVLYLGFTSGLLWVHSSGIGSATFGLRQPFVDALSIAADSLAALYWNLAAWRSDNSLALAHRATLEKLATGLSSCG